MWMDGQSVVAGTGGKLWAGIEGSHGGGGMAYDDGQTGTRAQARLGRRTGHRLRTYIIVWCKDRDFCVTFVAEYDSQG